MTTTTEKTAAGLGNWVDERLGASHGVKFLARKIFPDHWSFMLGEVALWSFVVLLLSGTFLTFFYIPSAGHTTYDGIYAPLAGQQVSEAYASTLRISFDIRGGLLMRQVHHWAALIFVVAMTVHMLRIFFTGAFRKPRELNWVIGCILLLLGIIEGFAGYSLPDDLLSGTGIRIASSIILAVPIVGSYVSFFLFGGEFPGESFIPRLYTIHVLLLPAIFLALIGAHMVMLVLQKHTQFPGPGRTNRNVVGFPMFPIYITKMTGFFFIVFGVITLMSTLITINPIWAYGGYDPSPVTAGSQPDWYMGWLDGFVRLTPGFFEFTLLGFTFSFNILIPALIIPGLMTMPWLLYPWIEQWVTGDKREHHLLDRPRNAPTRTALGMMALTFYTLGWISGGNDIIAVKLHLSINDITNTLRLLVFVMPPLVFFITKRICLGLQRRDREKVLHGRETGVIVRTETGEHFEVHEPLDEYARWPLVGYESYEPVGDAPVEDAQGVRRPGSALSGARKRISNFYFEDTVTPVTPAELEAAHHEHTPHDDHEVVEGETGHGHAAVGGGH